MFDVLLRIEARIGELEKRQAVQMAEQRALARHTRRQSLGGAAAIVGVVTELIRRYLFPG